MSVQRHSPPGTPPDCDHCFCLIAISSGSNPAHLSVARHIAFHSPCARCTPRSFNTEKNLCSFCHHLRLTHLLFCSPNWSLYDVRLGHWREIRERRDSGCLLCGIIDLTIQSYAFLCKPHQLPQLESCIFELGIYSTNPELPHPAEPRIRLVDNADKSMDLTRVLHVYLERSVEANHEKPIPGIWSVLPWNRIRGLLLECSENHEECQNIRSKHQRRALPTGFRLIDVRARRLVNPVGKCRFVALSYVWGRTPDNSKLLATVSNIHSLEQDGGLSLGKVSTSIEEAMQACTQLGERFLWADRLCIIQDDPLDKQQQIASMADIYALAEFVLVITSGDGVDDPVPGINSPRSCFTSTTHFGDLRVRSLLPRLPELLNQSTWGTRGWTYQEAALSNRKVYLTPLQFVFECERGHVYEDNSLNDTPWENTDVPFGMEYLRRLPQVFDAPESFVCYKEHVDEYNCRSLTNISDIYNAFTGILTGLYGRPSNCWHGLPLKDFHQALLWCSQARTSGYCDSPKRRFTTLVSLPTWSWSSIDGRLKFSPTSEQFYGPLTRWGQVESSGEVKMLSCQEPTKASHYFEWKQSYTGIYLGEYAAPQLMLAIAAAEGCMGEGPQMEPRFWAKSCFLDSANALGERWPRYQDFWAERFLSMHHTPNQDSPRPGTLLGHVQVSSLKVLRHTHHMIYERRCRVVGDCLEIRDGTSCIGIVDPDFPITIADGDTKGFEFVAVSVSGIPTYPDITCLHPNPFSSPLRVSLSSATRRDFSKEEQILLDDAVQRIRDSEMTYTDDGNTLLFPIPVVNVLMIERAGSVASRIGLGWVYLRRWAQVQRTNISIKLE